ncbi:MAG: hypothetical protein EZS26_001620 [Candidatus Ordinivivax streblomastigis]|uniref:Methyltransferase FkbM domain-containing protein n=1 Tax=Candidatus Ordinivivax streblomastigis TaxID=2540710 RepID=A0A5M8P1R3_9BACT|nr:MAG: hypothetical protein EZS26_001620 [Candidatus Ordinivivax streblomastigis]
MLKKIKARISKKKESQYIIGNYTITVPFDHKLPEYQRWFKNYDKKIKNIIQSIDSYENKDGKVIVDIGANIGDTATYIRSFTDAKIICVEGDNYYLEFLKKNIAQLPDIEIFPVFVQGRNEDGKYSLTRNNGTASLKEADEKSTEIVFETLNSILEKNDISLSSVEFLKIDTDGFDFDILLANESLIRRFNPNVYFEYDINYNENGIYDSIEVIKLFESLGYNFIVYDNFGNLLMIIDNNCISRFVELNHYLQSCKIYNGGIPYLDVFATVNKDVIKNIWENDNL